MTGKYFYFIRLLVLACSALYMSRCHAANNPGDSVLIKRIGDSVKVKAQTYTWVWSEKTDRFIIYDSANRRVVSGPLQPVVLVNTGRNTTTTCSSGKLASVNISGNKLVIQYSHVNETASLRISWRFDNRGLWFDPFEYTGVNDQDVVSLHYFSNTKNNQPLPGLEMYWLVQPGISASGAISPAQVLTSRINFDTWLGRGATIDNTRLLQQWGLPSHFFCGVSLPDRPSQVSALTTLRSNAFCCGLSELPAGDLRMITKEGRCAPVIDLRSDLWGQVRGTGPWKLGAGFYWSVAPDYRQAIRGYYQGLIKEGLVNVKKNSAAKNEVMAMAQFNTWGAQLSVNKYSALMDQKSLEDIYAGLRKSSMKTSIFVIDDKWEENYGTLHHSVSRLPRFEQFIERLRKDGFKIGMWAAFLRCDDPYLIGLDSTHVMRDINGRPLGKGSKPFYLLDASQPKVQEVLRNNIRQFMKRYRPDLVKFDFGYELPALSMSMPADPGWAGEKMLKKCLEVIVPVLREENPDVVVMYNYLSPLFGDVLDMHSTDDLFMNETEYELEANRRLFFSSLMGELGMPSYGSGGYNWKNMDDIWFDSSPSGTLGSLGSFTGDPSDTKPSDRDLAKFNGLAALARKSNVFSVEPMHATWFGANAGRASSWIRFEEGLPVLAALRTEHIIGTENIEAVYKDQLRSDVMVVVVSRDEKSITATKQLGIVPFGNGNIDILHTGRAASAKLRAHYLDGSISAYTRYPLKKGVLRIPLTERTRDKLIEWFEVVFE